MNLFEQQLFAERLAQEYVLGNQNLNEGIAKLADERDLSQVEIQKLAVAVNHAANERLRNSAEDLTFTFELADVNEVLGMINKEAEVGVDLSKVASAISEANPYHGEYDHLYEMGEMGSDSDQELRLRQAKQTLNKLAQVAQRLRDDYTSRRTGEMAKIAEELPKLTQTVKNYLQQTEHNLEDVCKYAALAMPGSKITQVVMTKVAQEMTKHGHVFTGTLADPTEMVKETFERRGASVPTPGVTVINGETPIQKSLRIIHTGSDNINAYEHMVHEIDSLSSVIGENEQALNSNEAVSKYLLQDLDSFYSQAMKVHGEQDDLPKVAAVVGAVSRGLRAVTGVGILGQAATMAGGAVLSAGHGAAMNGAKSMAAPKRRGSARSAGIGAGESTDQTQL